MAEEKKTVELVSKDGSRSWSTSDQVEITNLKAQGWRDASVEAPAPVADKSAAPKSTK